MCASSIWRRFCSGGVPEIAAKAVPGLSGTHQGAARLSRRGVEDERKPSPRHRLLARRRADRDPDRSHSRQSARELDSAELRTSDSAEAFVFLSGLSVGLIYLPRARKYGLEPVAGGCFRRALKLYGVHIALTLGALFVFGVAYWMSGVSDLIEAHGRSLVFGGAPANGLLGLALLSHQLGYFNILPLYIVLMLWAPVVVALALRGPLLALTVSVGLYAAARAFGLDLPNWPQPGGWFFNPMAWQLIFTLGLVSAILWRDGLPRPAPWLIALSAATVVGAALIVTDEAGFAPGLRDTATAHLDVAKQDLGLARLVHFVALAYLIAMATAFGGSSPRWSAARSAAPSSASAATACRSSPPARSRAPAARPLLLRLPLTPRRGLRSSPD